MALMVPTAIIGVVIKRLSNLVEEEVVMLWGVQDDLKKLKKKLETMAEVLEDAEEKEFQDKAIHRWLEGVRDAMYDAEDIVDDCIVMHKLNLGKKHKIGKRIKAVNSKIDGVHEERLKHSLVPTVRVQGFVPQTASHKQRPETSEEFI
ncbi:putative disease resistance protein RGA1 [Acorus calamus]|uniref:Disease resistance protein RGA1 n=1 Tax=Acorus calamus TaxID=4465 RepID=A0AAV9DN08_ACOCL|nr:putative disease resistance protein RGA1 [Acorus calamus]